MAARIEAPAIELLDLPQLSAVDLDPLLAEEINAWSQRFAWDFRPSADLLRRYIHMRSLAGCALRFNRETVGYAYYVIEGKKALIGDFFLRESFRTPEFESVLLDGLLRAITRTANIRRVESQLMMLRTPLGAALPIPFNGRVHRHERSFLSLNSDQVAKLPSVVPSYRVHFVPWAERYTEDMAHLVAAAYRGHIDSEINDQYRSIPGARQFLTNIIRYPGCGRFSPQSSLLAIDGQTGKVCGMCLGSLIGATSGHITQLCILPALRHVRLGYELLRQSILRLKHEGCESVSLTVTCANVEAIRLYRSVGFRSTATFPALVWERI